MTRYKQSRKSSTIPTRHAAPLLARLRPRPRQQTPDHDSDSSCSASVQFEDSDPSSDDDDEEEEVDPPLDGHHHSAPEPPTEGQRHGETSWFATPLIQTIAQPWFETQFVPIPGGFGSDIDATSYHAMPSFSFSTNPKILLDQNKRRCQNSPVAFLEYNKEGGYIDGVHWGHDVSFKLGDTVIVGSADLNLKDPTSKDWFDSYWFGRVVEIQLKSTPPELVQSARGRRPPSQVMYQLSGITLHLHYFQHGAALRPLGRLARQNELLLTDTCGNVSLSGVLGTCRVRRIGPCEPVPLCGEVLGYDFYYAYLYAEPKDTGQLYPRLQTIPTNDVSHVGPCCVVCQYAADQKEFGSPHTPEYHAGDFVRITSQVKGGNLADLVYIKKLFGHASFECYPLIRRSSRIKHSAGAETRLVFVRNGYPVTLSQEVIIGRIVVKFSSDNSIRVDGSFFYNEMTDNYDFQRPSELVILLRAPSELRQCRKCEEIETLKTQFLAEEGQLRKVDAYAGGGGLICGLTSGERIKTAMAIDIDPSATLTLRSNLPRSANIVNYCANKLLGHVSGLEVSAQERNDASGQTQPREPLPNRLPSHIDIVALGPPCQENSSLNQHASSGDTNLAFVCALNYVSLLQPNYVIMENVPNFLEWKLRRRDGDSPDRGLSVVLACLLAMNYQSTFGLLNAQHFGAPQGRRRFFLMAAKRGLQLPLLPRPTHYAPEADNKLKMRLGKSWTGHTNDSSRHPFDGSALFTTPTVMEAIGDLAGIGGPQTYSSPPATVFQARCRRRSSSISAESLQHFTQNRSSTVKNRVFRIGSHDGADYKTLQPGDRPWSAIAPESAAGRSNFRHGLYYARVSKNGYFPTITTNMGPSAKQARCIHPTERRELTIRELARAQGFPDHWVFKSKRNNDKDMVRQIGNAVCCLVAEAIEREIFESRFNDWVSQDETQSMEL